jgi:hypothetical protein
MTEPATESVDELANRVAPMVGTAVDELQVAAVLESQGFTDQVAKEKYGLPDVFALAGAVFQKLPRDIALPREETRIRTIRELSHGPLYVLPSLAYPAVFEWLGGQTMVHGLVFATAIGWWWSMGMSLVAYRLFGHGLDRAAGRSLRIHGAIGLGAVAAGSLLIDPRLWMFCLAQMGFQVASCVLVTYRREAWVAILMIPACANGLANLVFDGLMTVALHGGALSIVLMLAASWYVTGQAGPDARKAPRALALLRSAAPSVAYAALCAGFMLNTDARFVTGDLDLGIAVAPLVLGMGAVEWRAHRYSEQALDLLTRSRSVSVFRRDTWWLLVRELAACLVILGCLGIMLLGVLGHFGLLTTQGALLVDAHVLLGGVFFLGFVLMRYEGLNSLLVIMPVVLIGNIVVNRLVPGAEVTVFLAGCALLLAGFLLVLRVTAGQVRRYR